MRATRGYQTYQRLPSSGRKVTLGLNNLLSRIGLAITVLGFTGAACVYVRVQVMQSYPFYRGVFGSEYLLPGLTYTVALEMFGVIAAAGLFTNKYASSAGTKRTRITRAIGSVLLILGVLVAAIVYAETCLVWGEVLPGVHLWQGLPGGGGYPWGYERVAYNTCLIPGGKTVNCEFLNYDELFWIALLSALVGYVMRNS
jgi:hypothetical protein